MFNKLVKLRGSAQPKKKRENAFPKSPVSAVTFSGSSISSYSSDFPFEKSITTDPAEFRSTDEVSFDTGESSSLDSSYILDEGLHIGLPILPAYEDAEEQFLQDYEGYFEHLQVDNIRKEEYPKLALQRLVYLDYANFALFSRYQIEEHMRVLLEEGPNLGSVSLSNASGSQLMGYVFEAQQRLLQLFNVDNTQYSVIFTTGFTAGCRLFGDIYPVKRGTVLLTLVDNHEAVKHVVSAFTLKGGKCIMAPVHETEFYIHGAEVRQLLKRHGWRSASGGGGIFIYPAQSNLSGVCHSLNWVPEAQQNGWQVLLDVSTYLPSGPLDLSLYNADFVLGSLHHMLGYPSGMGFLLVRRQTYSILEHSGSLSFTSMVNEGDHCHIVSEDDNINVLSFAALSFGLYHLENVGLIAIQRRTQSLAVWLLQTLKSLRHKNEAKPLVEVYGSASTKIRGSLVSFNLVDSTGNTFPASLVQKLASKSNIVIGFGHFNNPGLSALLSSSVEEAMDPRIFINMPKFSGLRVSLGPMSNFEDVFRLVQFLLRFRDEDYVSTEAVGFIEEGI